MTNETRGDPRRVGDFLTDEEKKTLMLLRAYASTEPIAESELLDVLTWANGVRMANAMLDTVLEGSALPVGLKDKSDPDSMQLKLTEKGRAGGAALAEQLKKRAR